MDDVLRAERHLEEALEQPSVGDACGLPDRTNGGRAVRNVERVREAIATAYRAAPDLANITGTGWGALQAVTASWGT